MSFVNRANLLPQALSQFVTDLASIINKSGLFNLASHRHFKMMCAQTGDISVVMLDCVGKR